MARSRGQRIYPVPRTRGAILHGPEAPMKLHAVPLPALALCIACGDKDDSALPPEGDSDTDPHIASKGSDDGLVTIEKKACGAYTTLASTHAGSPVTRSWHTLRFVAQGAELGFSVSSTLMLSVVDHSFSWGTYRIRTDHMDGYFDDWTVDG
jgi:hypothetical protein